MLRWPKSWRGKGLLVDTNILLLFVVGRLDPNLIPKHKRTKQFIAEDYEILVDFLGRFTKILTTPNVLTEVSNLLAQIDGEIATKLWIVLGALVKICEEHYVPSIEAGNIQEFRRMGLTDSSILLLAEQDLVVLTDDRHLYSALQSKGLAAINFHHLRDRAWG